MFNNKEGSMKRITRFSRYLLLGITILIFSATSTFAAPRRGGDFIALYAQFPPHFNSAINSGAAIASPASNIFVALVEINENWEPVPYLAKSWEISPDGMTYTFYLEEGTVFHDGKPVTSKDVAFSLGVSKNNHPFGPYMFGAVDRVETPDKYTAVIKLKKPHPALMIALSLPLMPILPEHVYSQGPIRKNPANIKAIGSGPFKVAEYNAGKSFILERFDKFMRPGRPYLDRYIGNKNVSPSASLIAVSRGEAHSWGFVGDPQMVAKLKKEKNLTVTSQGYQAVGSVDFLEFNLRKKYVKDKKVRQAIAYAIDRDFITQKLHRGLTHKSTGPIHSSSPFYSDQVNQFEFNLEKANQLLDEAGYKRQADGMRFSLNLIYMPALPYAQKMIAEYLKPQLKKIGIKINLKAPADFMNWYTNLAKWEHDMSTSNIFGWGDPVIGIHRLFMSTNIKHQVWTNTAGYVNKKVDGLLNAAAVENDMNKRKALYAEFQKIVAEDVPFYFTIEDAFHSAFNKELMDYPTGIWGAMGTLDGMYWKNGKAP
jgi:peptide/nickel transport system substrate-binding protein